MRSVGAPEPGNPDQGCSHGAEHMPIRGSSCQPQSRAAGLLSDSYFVIGQRRSLNYTILTNVITPGSGLHLVHAYQVLGTPVGQALIGHAPIQSQIESQAKPSSTIRNMGIKNLYKIAIITSVYMNGLRRQ